MLSLTNVNKLEWQDTQEMVVPISYLQDVSWGNLVKILLFFIISENNF